MIVSSTTLISKERLNLSKSDSLSHQSAFIGKDYVMEIWDNSNGLPQNAVYALEKDNTGFVWLATEEGLVRLDGNLTKVFDRDHYPEMLEQTYYSFFKSKSGIWAAADKSIAHLEKTITKVIDCSQITDNNWIRGIIETSNGELLIGTQNGKIYVWKDEVFKLLEFWNPEPLLEIHSLFNLKNGNILAGTNQGLYEINFGLKNAKLISSRNFSTDRIFGNSSTIYISSLESGIYRLTENFKMEQVLSYQDVKDINPVSLTTDGENRIWAGSLEMGLIIIENGVVSRLNYPEIKNFTVRKIIKEKEAVYLGTLGKGLAVVKSAKVKQLNFEILKEKNIKAIYQAPDSSIWVGTRSSGIHRIKSGEIKSINVNDGLLQNGVITIGSKGDKVYVGSHSGVSVVDIKSGNIIDKITVEDGLKSNYTYAIYKDSNNWLWILTRYGGMHYIDNSGVLHKVDLPENFANTNFTSIHELGNKQIIIGSMNYGFFRISNGKYLENQTLPLTPGENIIYCIYEDEEGDLWFGTHGGMVLLRNGKFKALKKSNGLKSQSVYSITKDKFKGVWVSNNFGVQFIPNTELERFKESTDKNFFSSSILYNETMGMPNSEANGLIFPSALKDFSGNIWIPTVEGIGIVDINTIPSIEQNTSNFQWDELRVGNLKVPINDRIEIPKGEKMFQISFTCIDFINPDQYSFFYRIKGQNDNWISVNDQWQVIFNGFKPGEYTLEVKVFTYGKPETIRSLPIVVRAYFFETLTFKVIIAICLFLLIYLLIKFYFNLKIKNDLEKLVNQRTLELSNTNDKLKYAISEIEAQNSTLKEITWNQSHLVRGPLTKAMGINQLLIKYPKYANVGKSREQLEIELFETLRQLDEIVRDTHYKSENLRK